MTRMILKTIRVEDDVHKRLTKHGQWGESMSSIIGRLLDYYEGDPKMKEKK